MLITQMTPGQSAETLLPQEEDTETGLQDARQDVVSVIFYVRNHFSPQHFWGEGSKDKVKEGRCSL